MTQETMAPEIPAARRFDTKVVVVLAEGLVPWQELNVTAFLMSGIAISDEGLTGEPYRDADGVDYLPMLREPVLVMTGDGALLQEARRKAASRLEHSAGDLHPRAVRHRPRRGQPRCRRGSLIG